jgi:hypothetical protein
MTFQIGKFYKAGKSAENFYPGTKLLCVDMCGERDEYTFYSNGVLQSEKREACQNFEEWREPQEFTLLRNNLGYYEYTPELKLEPGETIKLREVL